MIARFIYTDCETNGPFSSGVGKKFKSVVVPSDFVATSPAIGALKDRLPRNSLSEGYQLPNIPNSMTMAEFDALPKSWAFAQITEDTFALERIGTAGQCYGRNNRFDEGFIMSPDAWAELTAKFTPATKPLHLRPADFVHSTGWLNPRGEGELETAELDSGFYELKPDFREQLKSDLALVKRLPNLEALTKAFAQSQLTGEAAFVPKAQAKDFFAIVAVLTRLTPPVYAWQTGFSDVWVEPRTATLTVGANPHFLLSDKRQPMLSGLAATWGNLAAEVFASGMPGKLMAKLDDLATNTFTFHPTSREQGLSLLPLAIMLSDATDLAGKETLVNLAANLLELIELPDGWVGDAQEKTLDNAAGAVYRTTAYSESIESKLTNIGRIR
jgi:hypothetical protein